MSQDRGAGMEQPVRYLDSLLAGWGWVCSIHPPCLPFPGHLGSQHGLGGTLRGRGLADGCASVTSLSGLHVTRTGKASVLWDSFMEH